MNPAELHTSLRRAYPLKLRRGVAVRLAAALGCTDYAFRALVTAGRITPQHLAGTYAHYDREQIIRVLSGGLSPVS